MSFRYESHKVPADGRFEVSKDTFSQARFAALVETTRDLQTHNPAFITTVLWGSLSKGKLLSRTVLSSTDIDLSAFYDADTEPDGIEIGPVLNAAILTGVHERLLQIGDKPIVNVHIFPMQREGNLGVLGQFFACVRGDYENERELNHMLLGIASAFGFDLTGKLQPYRNHFFHEVEQQLPEEMHDKVWGRISEIMKIVERGKRGTTSQYDLSPTISKFYPATFRDAKMMYGIHT